MDIATKISVGSLVVSAGSLAVATAAFVKGFASDRREREAVVSIDAVWHGRLAEFSFNESKKKQLPKVPDRRYVIAPAPVIAENIALREATVEDDRDEDAPNYTTYRALLQFRNGGRAIAEAPVFHGRIVGHLFNDAHAFDDDFNQSSVVPRSFPFQLSLASLPVDVQFILEIRCMVSVPTTIHFDTVECTGQQPARLTAPTRVDFQPRA